MTDAKAGNIDWTDLELKGEWSNALLRSLSKDGPASLSRICVWSDGLNESSNSLFLTTILWDRRFTPGIKLTRTQGIWLAEPLIAGSTHAHGAHGVLNAPIWLERLVFLSQKMLRRLLSFAKGESDRDLNMFAEANVRVNYFLAGGARCFFTQGFDALAWESSIRWPAWQANMLSTGGRAAELTGFLGAEVRQEWMELLDESKSTLSLKELRRLIGPGLGHLKQDWRFLESDTSSKCGVSLLSPRNYFSYGGDPRFNFVPKSRTATKYPEAGAGAVTEEGVSCLWWWKDSKAWGDSKLQTFVDNWERSALYYELHAREADRTQKWPFSVPWCWLNNNERGILSLLWPSLRVGERRLAKPTTSAALAFARDYAEDQVRKYGSGPGIWDRFYEEALKVYAYGNLPKSRKGPMLNLSHYWVALENLDRARYLSLKLTKFEHSTISKLRREYREACACSGVEP